MATVDKETNVASHTTEEPRNGSEPGITTHHEKMGFRKWMVFLAMAFLWTGSQLAPYLFGSIPPIIYGDIGGVDRWTWFVLGYLFSLAAVCPFVGSLSDIFGRRYVALFGTFLLIVGCIVASTAKTMNVFIGGMTINGAGAGLNELTCLAVTSEIAPTRKRGLYVAVLIFTILPFCPSVLWAQQIAYYGSWRYCGIIVGVWSFIGFVLTAVFYHPPPRHMTLGLSRRETLRRIDYGGGLLSISGLLLVTMAVQWGGYQYPWGSAHVVATLVLGILLCIGFILWEWKVAKYPMFPRAIFHEPRLIALTLAITFISGMNFFSILLFWPTQSYNVYGHDHWGVGIRNLALGFPILAGACIILVLLSFTQGRIRELMLISCIFMTAGTGAMAALNRDNIWLSYILLIIAGLGVGGIVVPASIITAIICPDELIATVTALTLAIRVLGGAIGYSIYYNVFATHFEEEAIALVGRAAVVAGITNREAITEIIQLTAAGLVEEIRKVPGVNTEAKWQSLVSAGQEAYARSYPWVYYVSIAFGSVSIVASLFLGNIKKYMDDHVAADYNEKIAPQDEETVMERSADHTGLPAAKTEAPVATTSEAPATKTEAPVTSTTAPAARTEAPVTTTNGH